MALFLTSLGGGLSWYLPSKFTSSDLYVTGFTFTSAFQRPHVAIGTLLYLSSLILFYRLTQSNRLLFSHISLFCLFLLVFFYPYYLLSYFLICVLYIVFSRRKTIHSKALTCLILNLILVGLLTLFYLKHLQQSGFTGIVSQQLPALKIISLLLGYGLYLPIFLFQLVGLKKNQNLKIFLTLWFSSSILLSFLPFGFARFYLRGLFFPLVLLTLLALKDLSQKLLISEKTLVFILLIISPLSSLFIFQKRLAETKNLNPWFYQPLNIKEGFSFLAKQKANGVLTDYLFGNYIPAYTGKNVYFGHLIQTPKVREKIFLFNEFFQRKLKETQAKTFLDQNHISFIVVNPREKEKQHPDYPFLEKIYYNNNIEIFAVKKD